MTAVFSYVTVGILLLTTVLAMGISPGLDDSDDAIIPIIVDVIEVLANGQPANEGSPCVAPKDDVTSENLVKRMIPKKFYQLARLRTGMSNASEEARIRAKLLQRLRQLISSGGQRHTDE